jgi:hypothetical protein
VTACRWRRAGLFTQSADEHPPCCNPQWQRRDCADRARERGETNELQAERDGGWRRAQDQQCPILRAIAPAGEGTPAKQGSQRSGRIQTKAPRTDRLLDTFDGERTLRSLMADAARSLVDQWRGGSEPRFPPRHRDRSQEQDPAPEECAEREDCGEYASHTLL